MGHIIISIQVDKKLKEEAVIVYQEMGMDLSTAITLFLKQSVRDQSMPFKPSLNNLTNIQVRDDIRQGQTEKFNSVEEWWTNLNED